MTKKLEIIKYYNGCLIFVDNHIVLIGKFKKFVKLKKLFESQFNQFDLIFLKKNSIFNKNRWIVYFHRNDINEEVFQTFPIFHEKGLTQFSHELVMELFIKNSKIKNYFKKNIEFLVYDYALKDSDFLLKYNFFSLWITHENDKIIFEFNKIDAILGIWICFLKFSEINSSYEPYILFNTNERIIDVTDLEEWQILFLVSNSFENNYQLIIKTKKKYNLTEECGIICYFNLNDEYDNIFLDKLLQKSKYFTSLILD